jgi:hypothetical protein
MNVTTAVILTTTFNPAYKVMRCAAAAGAHVVVVASPGTRECPKLLARSRFCDRFILMTSDLRLRADARIELADSLDRVQPDWLIPSDIESFEFLIEAPDQFAGARYPLPSLEVFNGLADKGSFAKLCERLRVPHPLTVVAPKVELLDLAPLDKRPIVIKPVRGEGGRGVTRIERSEQLATIRYGPVLAQEYIPGKDLGISMVCDRGRIIASIAFSYDRGVYHVFHHPRLHHFTRVIVEATGYSGPLNVDAREDMSGNIYVLECNPRFFFNTDIVLMAGLNFVELGFHRRATEIRAPEMRIRSAFSALLNAWRMTYMDRLYLGYQIDESAGFLVRDFRRRMAKRAWGTNGCESDTAPSTELDTTFGRGMAA